MIIIVKVFIFTASLLPLLRAQESKIYCFVSDSNEKFPVAIINSQYIFTSSNQKIPIEKVVHLTAYKYDYISNELTNLLENYAIFKKKKMTDQQFLESVCLGVNYKNYKRAVRHEKLLCAGKLFLIHGNVFFSLAGVGIFLEAYAPSDFRYSNGPLAIFTYFVNGLIYVALSVPFSLSNIISIDKNNNLVRYHYFKKVRKDFYNQRHPRMKS